MKLKEYPKIYLYKRVVHAKMYIDKNFFEALNLNLVSDEATFSKFHFIRLFKTIYSLTPHQYLRKVRMENAKFLLAQGHSITGACERSGFESVSTFTSLFKKENGTTPAVYRQLKLALRNEMKFQPNHFIPNCFAAVNELKKSNFEEVA